MKYLVPLAPLVVAIIALMGVLLSPYLKARAERRLGERMERWFDLANRMPHPGLRERFVRAGVHEGRRLVRQHERTRGAPTRLARIANIMSFLFMVAAVLAYGALALSLFGSRSTTHTKLTTFLLAGGASLTVVLTFWSAQIVWGDSYERLAFKEEESAEAEARAKDVHQHKDVDVHET